MSFTHKNRGVKKIKFDFESILDTILPPRQRLDTFVFEMTHNQYGSFFVENFLIQSEYIQGL